MRSHPRPHCKQACLEEQPEEILAAFKEKRMDEFWTLVEVLNSMAGERAEFYRKAGDRMVAEEAYLPAAVFYLQVFRYDPSILKPEQAIRDAPDHLSAGQEQGYRRTCSSRHAG